MGRGNHKKGSIVQPVIRRTNPIQPIRRIIRTTPTPTIVRQTNPSLFSVFPKENGSVYLMLNKYAPTSDETIFSKADILDEARGYRFFSDAMERKIRSGGYDPYEAKVVCKIFEQTMLFLFYKKALQEIQSLGLTEEEQRTLLEHYSIKREEQNKIINKIKTSPPPPDFNSNALWFATFSNQPAPYLSPTREHVGSIYFDGGRIRLMHTDGPIVVRNNSLARTLDGEVFLDKPTNAVAFDTMVSQRQRQGKPAVLVEYDAFSSSPHTSRGCPKTIRLIDEDIAQLYYLAGRITLMQTSKQLGQLQKAGVSKKQIINAGNKLMADFIYYHARLRAALGYW